MKEPVATTAGVEQAAADDDGAPLGSRVESGSSRPPPSRLRSLAITGLKLGLTVALFAYLFSRPGFDIRNLTGAILSPWFLLVLFLGFVGISMSGLRWQILLRGEGIQIGLGTVLRLTWIGHFWNMVIPGAVSGDAVKMYYVGRAAPALREEAWTTVFVDRVIGLVALVSVSTVAAFASVGFIWERAQLRALFLSMLGVLLLSLLVALCLALGVGREWRIVQALRRRLPMADSLTRAYHSAHRLGRRPHGLLASYGISIAAHALAVVNAYLLGRAAGEDLLGFVQYCVVVPITLFTNAVPLTPGGLGVGENVLGKLFEWTGGAFLKGVEVMLLYRVSFYILASIGAVLYVFGRKPGDEVAPEAQPVVAGAEGGAANSG